MYEHRQGIMESSPIMGKSMVKLGRKLNAVKTAFGRSVCAAWATRGVEMNWGDNLNPYLIQKLSGRPVMHARDVHTEWASEIYGVIGSWLGNIRYPNLVVWGLGFIKHDDAINNPPKRINAVRGFRTLTKLREAGHAEPLPVGDPALLIPLLYAPRPRARTVIGIIPQHRDRNLPIFDKFSDSPGYRVIDICSDIEDFCEQLAECEAIVSSSLHAVVAAHAYKIPAQFIKVSNNPLGDGFKLLDYLSSVGREECPPIACTSADDIKKAGSFACLPRYFPDMLGLISSCPFMPAMQKAHYRTLAEAHYRIL